MLHGLKSIKIATGIWREVTSASWILPSER